MSLLLNKSVFSPLPIHNGDSTAFFDESEMSPSFFILLKTISIIVHITIFNYFILLIDILFIPSTYIVLFSRNNAIFKIL